MGCGQLLVFLLGKSSIDTGLSQVLASLSSGALPRSQVHVHEADLGKEQVSRHHVGAERLPSMHLAKI